MKDREVKESVDRKENNNGDTGIDRRGFLKCTAVLGGAVLAAQMDGRQT